jgi:hypothetical protein
VVFELPRVIVEVEEARTTVRVMVVVEVEVRVVVAEVVAWETTRRKRVKKVRRVERGDCIVRFGEEVEVVVEEVVVKRVRADVPVVRCGCACGEEWMW